MVRHNPSVSDDDGTVQRWGLYEWAVRYDGGEGGRRKLTIKEAIKQPLCVYNTHLDTKWHQNALKRWSGEHCFCFGQLCVM